MTTDRVAGGVLVLIGLFVIWESLASARRLPLGSLRTPGPAYMPVFLAVLLVAFGAVLVVLGARASRFATIGWSEWRHAVAILAVCLFAALMLERLGYRLTMTVVLAVLLGVVERKRALFTVVFSLALALGAFFLFDTFLRVPLPRGPFGL